MKWFHGFSILFLAVLSACSPDHFGDGRDALPAGTVTVYSTTDAAIFAPVIADFKQVYPHVLVDYIELDARPLNERFLTETHKGAHRADILLSAAMDLQVKLVNDGYAAPHHSKNAERLPNWARWRDEIFGLTFEPVVMVINPDRFEGLPVPASRFELVKSLRSNPEEWRNQIGTYNIEVSSTGYLLATQDARLSSEFAPLLEAMGDVSPKTFQNSSALLTAIETGQLKLGYNVLGSYAKQRIQQGAKLRIIYPEDYTLAVVRSAFVSKYAPNPEGAHAFLEYLMSIRGQQILSTKSNLDAVREEIRGQYGRLGFAGSAVGPLRPIPIGPGLLTYLDKQKRERFLENWRSTMAQVN